MPYVSRNKNGEIESLHHSPPTADAERLGHEQSTELLEFLNQNQSQENIETALSSSDLGLIRVIEDLIEMLCENHTIVFTDLPEWAQHKLGVRKNIRKTMEPLDDLIDEDEGIISCWLRSQNPGRLYGCHR